MRHAIRDAATGSTTAVTTAPALATTGVLPPPIQPRPPAHVAPARRRLGPVFVAAAILAAVAVGGAVVARGGTDGGTTDVARAAAEATTLPPTTAPPTTTPCPRPGPSEARRGRRREPGLLRLPQRRAALRASPRCCATRTPRRRARLSRPDPPVGRPRVSWIPRSVGSRSSSSAASWCRRRRATGTGQDDEGD